MFKRCPRCRDEFLQHVLECPDCRVPLRSAEELASEPAQEPSASVALDSAVVLRRGAASELRELCAVLKERGVRFVVDAHPLGRRQAPAGRGRADAALAIYVDEADADEAARVEREWVVATLPEAPSELRAGSLDACPGCGEPLAEGAAACASCGLEFPPLEVACPQCGQAVAVEADRCAHCGYRP